MYAAGASVLVNWKRTAQAAERAVRYSCEQRAFHGAARGARVNPVQMSWLAVVSILAAVGPHLEMQLGSHGLLEVRNVTFETLNSSAAVLNAMLAAVRAGGLSVVGEPMMQQFPVMGVSGIVLLSESHISVHTWPEHGYSAIDLFTCGSPAPPLCGQSGSTAYFNSSDAAWLCDDGATADIAGAGGIWAAAAAAVQELRAGAATFTLVDRGMPQLARGNREAKKENSGFGWLGWLEAGDWQREL